MLCHEAMGQDPRDKARGPEKAKGVAAAPGVFPSQAGKAIAAGEKAVAKAETRGSKSIRADGNAQSRCGQLESLP
jgi:hypothetical protein